jgi:hypothetical protein
MNTYFECKLNFIKIDQAGYERKCNDVYLLDAVSYTDAETRMYEKAQQLTKGAFAVKSIKASAIAEVLADTHGEYWWKARIQFVTIDEEAGREKKTSQYMLVMGDDAKQALENLENGLSYMLVPYRVVGLVESTIVDVFPYDLEAAAAKLPAGERPEGVVFENDEESEGGDE